MSFFRNSTISKQYKISELKLGYSTILPVLLILSGLILIPVVWAIFLSFTNKIVGVSPKFIGIENYKYLLSDSLFRRCVLNTLVYTIFCVFFKTILGVLVAVVLNQDFKFRNLTRALLLLPWIVPTLVTALTWRWMFDDMAGLINFLLKSCGLIDRDMAWLASPKLAMLSVMIVNIWRGTPFVAITVLASLQTFPKSLTEAAVIDGANSLQNFFYIVIPSVYRTIFAACLFTTIWTFNDFELVFLLTRGGPMNMTKLLSILSFEISFGAQKIGLGTSVFLIISPILLILIIPVVRATLNEEKSE